MIQFISNGGYKSFLFNTVSAIITLGASSVVGWQIFHGMPPNPYAITIISAYGGFQFGTFLNTMEKGKPKE